MHTVIQSPDILFPIFLVAHKAVAFALCYDIEIQRLVSLSDDYIFWLNHVKFNVLDQALDGIAATSKNLIVLQSAVEEEFYDGVLVTWRDQIKECLQLLLLV